LLLATYHSRDTPYPPCANDNSPIKMTLPRSSINGIKSNLDRAVSAKDPAAIATAVDVPLPTSNDVGGIIGTSNNINPSSGSVHREQLKIDNVDWSNVLNFLLDVHLAIISVRFTHNNNNNNNNKLLNAHENITGRYRNRALINNQKDWIKNSILE
jgi:hypothetical protein